MIEPYWTDGSVTLYHGKLEVVLEALHGNGFRADLAVVDPPYADTSYAWDRWPFGWPTGVANLTDSMWCFGSARMFDTDAYRDDIRAGGWRMSHDVIWEKTAPTSNLRHDRFSRVHEHVRHFYRADRWQDIYHVPDRANEAHARAGSLMRRSAIAPGMNGHRAAHRVVRDGKAFITTVLHHPNVRGGIHPSQKPVPILEPLIRYGCPQGGVVLDPMAGSGSTGKACQHTGRRAVLIEGREEQCELTARWLSETPMITVADVSEYVEPERPAAPTTEAMF